MRESPLAGCTPPLFSGAHIAQSLAFCVLFCRSVCVPFSFYFAIELSVLRFTSSDYLFGLFFISDIFLIRILPAINTIIPKCMFN